LGIEPGIDGESVERLRLDGQGLARAGAFLEGVQRHRKNRAHMRWRRSRKKRAVAEKNGPRLGAEHKVDRMIPAVRPLVPILGGMTAVDGSGRRLTRAGRPVSVPKRGLGAAGFGTSGRHGPTLAALHIP
jgi:hypothetical protein